MFCCHCKRGVSGTWLPFYGDRTKSEKATHSPDAYNQIKSICLNEQEWECSIWHIGMNEVSVITVTTQHLILSAFSSKNVIGSIGFFYPGFLRDRENWLTK